MSLYSHTDLYSQSSFALFYNWYELPSPLLCCVECLQIQFIQHLPWHLNDVDYCWTVSSECLSDFRYSRISRHRVWSLISSRQWNRLITLSMDRCSSFFIFHLMYLITLLISLMLFSWYPSKSNSSVWLDHSKMPSRNLRKISRYPFSCWIF